MKPISFLIGIAALISNAFNRTSKFEVKQIALPSPSATPITWQEPYPTISPSTDEEPTPTQTDRPSETNSGSTQIEEVLSRTVVAASPKPDPTAIPRTPQPTSKATDEPSIQTNITSTGSLIDQVNAFRAENGKAAFQPENYTCSFANLRASEVAGDFSHTGFYDRVNNDSLPFPSYTHVSENIAMNPVINNVVPEWINSPGHKSNLLADDKNACIAQNGNYFVFISWNP